MKALYVNDPRPARRGVYVQLFDPTGLAPATGEAGGQPTWSLNGSAPPINTGGVLVAVQAANGLYHVEFSQANLAGLRDGDTVLLIYKSGNTLPFAREIPVEALRVVHEGVAQGGTLTSLVLQNANGVATVDDRYNDMIVELYDGPGSPDVQEIADHVGASFTITPRFPFHTAPVLDTTKYRILIAPPVTEFGQVPVTLAPNAVNPVSVQDGTFSALKFASAFLTADGIADLAFLNTKFADAFLTAQKVADNALPATKFPAGFLTASKAGSDFFQAIRTEMDNNSIDLNAAVVALDALLSRLTATRAAALDLLDQAVSTRATAAQVGVEVDAKLTGYNLDHLAGTAAGIPALPAGTWVDEMRRKPAGAFNPVAHSLEALAEVGGASGAPSATANADALLARSAAGGANGGFSVSLALLQPSGRWAFGASAPASGHALATTQRATTVYAADNATVIRTGTSYFDAAGELVEFLPNAL